MQNYRNMLIIQFTYVIFYEFYTVKTIFLKYPKN